MKTTHWLIAAILIMSNPENSLSQTPDPTFTWDKNRDALFRTPVDSPQPPPGVVAGTAHRVIGPGVVEVNTPSGRKTVTLFSKPSQASLERLLSPGTPVWIQFFGTDRVSGYPIAVLYLNANCRPETSVEEILKK